jgi:NADH-quinone oxidoreductase subunit L
MLTTYPESSVLAWIVLLPLLGAVINGVFGSRFSPRVVTFFGVGSVAVSFLLAAYAVFHELGCLELILDNLGLHDLTGPQRAQIPNGVAVDLWDWIVSIPGARGDLVLLEVDMALLLDRLSAVMVLIVTGVGMLIHVFSVGYMREKAHGYDPGYWRYFAYLNLFMFSMLLLVLGKNLLVLFVGWEGVGLCSYLLIGFWYGDMAKAIAGKKAFITNRIGDFGFLIGIFVILFYTGGSLDFDAIGALTRPGGNLDAFIPGLGAHEANQKYLTVTLIAVLLFVGACGKSAQIPLHVWLPDAMAGPTPVSALIHAATMVTAGVYMMCRLNLLFSASAAAMTIVAGVGAATALFAATIALVQTDIKKVLAYSTVSQLGFMVAACGVGAYTAAIFHLMTHAFFKACLFLGSGSVIHALHHEQDIRKMGGLKAKLPVTAWTFKASCLAIAGIPPLAGFFSKDEILVHAFTNQRFGAEPLTWVWALLVAASLCTAFYMFRLYYLTFEGTYRGDPHAYEHAQEEPVMTWPLRILAGLAIAGGLLGIPAVFFEAPHVLGRWLAPPFLGGARNAFYWEHEVSHSLEWGLMGLATVLAIAGWQVAKRIYTRPAAALPGRPAQAAWFKLLDNKGYVDEIYGALIIRPFVGFARFCYRWIDNGLIDTDLLHGLARVLGWCGNQLRRLQTGDVQTYVTGIVIGVALLLSIGFLV